MTRITALILTLMLSACGVKGPLEAPPGTDDTKKKTSLSLVIGG